ncbi:MAG: HlyD family efflux transporter periplasmic adaptor subunit [Blastopirellula sp. JB062]
MRRQSNNNRSTAGQIPAAEAVLADLARQLAAVTKDAERLRIQTPCSGVVFPPPRRTKATKQERRLPTWSGTPLDPANRGALLERGELLAIVAEPQAIEARLFIRQSDVDLLAVGDSVKLLFDGLAGERIEGRIVEISRDDSFDAPRNLVQGADVPTRRDESGEVRLIERSYQATVELNAIPPELMPGSRGKAVALGRSLTLGQRLSRWISGNFRFRL